MIQDRVKAHFESTASSWRDIYTQPDFYSRLYQDRRSAVLALVDQLNLREASLAVDLGCGPGLISVALAQRGFRVLAVDTVATMVAMTRQHADQSGWGRSISTAVCDVRHLGLAPCTSDLIVMAGVTEWLTSLQQPLNEIVRVMKPGSYLIVTGDNSWGLHAVLDPRLTPLFQSVKPLVGGLLEKLRLRSPAPHCRLRSVRELDRALRAAGLQLIQRSTFGFGPFSILNRSVLGDNLAYKLHVKLQRLSDRRPSILRAMGHVYIAIAKKL